MRKKKKIHTNIINFGPKDSKKFTTTGHLIYKCGGSTKSHWKIGGGCCNRKGSFKDVKVLDKLEDECEYFIIIDMSLWKFETSKHYVTTNDLRTKRLPGTWLQACLRLIVLFLFLLLILVNLKQVAPRRFMQIDKFDSGVSIQILAYTLNVEQLIAKKMDSFSWKRYEKKNYRNQHQHFKNWVQSQYRYIFASFWLKWWQDVGAKC